MNNFLPRNKILSLEIFLIQNEIYSLFCNNTNLKRFEPTNERMFQIDETTLKQIERK